MKTPEYAPAPCHIAGIFRPLPGSMHLKQNMHDSACQRILSVRGGAGAFCLGLRQKAFASEAKLLASREGKQRGSGWRKQAYTTLEAARRDPSRTPGAE